MVLICFHTFDVPMVFLTGFEKTLFDIIPECSIKHVLPVLSNKDQMNHKQVLIVSSMLINIFHSFYLLSCNALCFMSYYI